MSNYIQSVCITELESFPDRGRIFAVVENLSAVPVLLHDAKGREREVEGGADIELILGDFRYSHSTLELDPWFVFAEKGGKLRVTIEQRIYDFGNSSKFVLLFKYYSFIPIEAMIEEVKQTVSQQLYANQKLRKMEL